MKNRMKRVYKYHIPTTGKHTLTLPVGAEILKFVVNTDFYLLALVAPEEEVPECNRTFLLVATEHDIQPLDNEHYEYIGSVIYFGVGLHLFEVFTR